MTTSSADVIDTTQKSILNINMSNVTKLNSTNYMMWSLQVHALIDGYALAHHLDSSKTPPPATIQQEGATIDNPEYINWSRQDKLIYSGLIGALSSSVQATVSMTKTTADIWRVLPFTRESEREEMSTEIMPFHHHPLLVHHDERYSKCYVCLTSDNRLHTTYYSCQECGLEFHKDCIESFLNHPIQINHLFKFFMYPRVLLDDDDQETMYSRVLKDYYDYYNDDEENGKKKYLTFDDDDKHRCYFCGRIPRSVYARCMIYNIIICRICVKFPPPQTIYQPKHHKHSLTLLSRLVTYTCNACGLQHDRNPYVCLECNMMVHKDCTDLPRVISINRHDHRVSHTFHLGQKQGGGDWKCGVCRKTIDWIYGAFKCSRCPSYAVHSKCATRKEVWDGVELEDIPEEEEIQEPFKVINEKGDIIHFLHENHILRLLDKNCGTDMLRCKGCFLAINEDPCYKCVECEFVLHKTCASLPRKKRYFLHNHRLVLRVDKVIYECRACRIDSSGFKYVCCEDRCKDVEVEYDVRCSSVSEPFQHDLHPQHPLYWTLQGTKKCKACGKKTKDILSCMDCEYALCMKCATLPRKVKNNRYDDHFLSLSQGVGNSSGDLWCDICETKTDPTKRYYTCEECGVSLHIDCVIGVFYYFKIGSLYESFSILENKSATRPLCSGCKTRCKIPYFMKVTTIESLHYFCTIDCYAPDE